MSARRFLMFALVAALTLTSVVAVQAGEGKGKIVKLDPAANVVILEDGKMYRALPDTVYIVEEKPVKFEMLKPGTSVVIQSGEPVQLKDGSYVVISPSASPASR